MAGSGAAGRSARRWAAAVLGLAVAGALAAGTGVAAAAPESALIASARAFTAAWNAHDLDAVLALFAPDAVVRVRRGAVPPEVWDSRDPQVVRAYQDGADAGANYDAGGFVWATGRSQIAAWAAAHFKEHHRFAAGPPRAAGGTVGWPYRAFVDPYQLLPGVGPTEGDAEAVVRGGRIATLTLVESSASVRRRGGEADAGFARAMATRRAAPYWDEPAGVSVPPGGPRGAARAAEPTPVGWPLALGGLGLLAAGAAAQRPRRPRRP